MLGVFTTGQTLQKIQLSFLKYIAQQIKFDLQKTDLDFLKEFWVDAKDRSYQFWKRNSLSIELFTEKVFWQKNEYIHWDPVNTGICKYPEEYYYSSAKNYTNRY